MPSTISCRRGRPGGRAGSTTQYRSATRRTAMTTKTTNNIWRCAAFAIATLAAVPAHAQLNGENLLGDMGVKSGTQPEPGLYISTLYYRYFTDTIKGPGGASMSLDPSG